MKIKIQKSCAKSLQRIRTTKAGVRNLFGAKVQYGGIWSGRLIHSTMNLFLGNLVFHLPFHNDVKIRMAQLWVWRDPDVIYSTLIAIRKYGNAH